MYQRTTVSTQLFDWHDTIDRDLPWKSTTDPYHIYLSEIILQQTRVEQGKPYYLKFIKKFPTVKSLASATEDEVFALWKGLGYYSRARNMHKTAKIIQKEYGGKLPQNYHELLALPGIGPYTAAAISSFAFNNVVPAIDGNVLRVVSRIETISSDILGKGKAEVRKWMEKQIDQEQPARFNQAMIDLGACCCLPKKPNCAACPFNMICKANKEGRQAEFPVKKKAKAKRERNILFSCYYHEDFLILKKQEKKDIWQGLYVLPNDSIGNSEENHLLHSIVAKGTEQSEQHYTQVLSHQKVLGTIRLVRLEEMPESIKHPYYLVERKNLNNYAVPKILDCFFHDNSIYLDKHNLSGKHDGK